MAYSHISVLADEVIELLSPAEGETVLDATLGLGGHSALFLEKIGPKGKLFCIDADSDNLNVAKQKLSSRSHVTFFHSNFSQLKNLDIPECDIIFADLGLSSVHLDNGERGFAFREDAPLDMRYDQTSGKPASLLLAELSEEEVADILWNFGEIRESRRIAKKIKEQVPTTTFALKKCVEDACGWRAKNILPQVFQAVRIAVNSELHSLSTFLETSIHTLKPGGRLGIISFHSLEDRMVKQYFKELTTAEKDPITGQDVTKPDFELVAKGATKPSDDEVKRNPRSRSARLRIIRRSS